MPYILETKMKSSDDWFEVIDLKYSQIKPVTRKFTEESIAINFAKNDLKLSEDRYRTIYVEDNVDG